MHRKLSYVSKHNKLVQLVKQVQYHVNAIYRQTRTHILMSRTKATRHVLAFGWRVPGLKIEGHVIYFLYQNIKSRLTGN